MARKHPVFFYLVEWILKPIDLFRVSQRALGLFFLGMLSLTLNGFLLHTKVSSAVNPPYRLSDQRPTQHQLIAMPQSSALQLVQQGRELYEAGQFSQAVTVWQQAASALQMQKDRLNQAMVLSNLSSAYQQLGQWTAAKEAIAESLKLLNTSSAVNHSQESLQVTAQALNTQGNLQFATGQPEQALSSWEQAATTYNQAGDLVGMTRSLINQSQALQALGLYRRALTTLEETVKSLEKQPDSLIKTASLRSLGNTLRVVGDLDKSRQVLEKSLALAHQLKSPQEISATLFSLGNTAQSQQEYPAALQFYQQAEAISPSPTLKIQSQLSQLSILVDTNQQTAAQLSSKIGAELDKLPPSRTAVYARIELAQSLIKSGSRGTSNPPVRNTAQLLATAVQQAKSLGDQRALSYALGNFGELYEQTQQFNEAQSLTQQALLLAQSINASDIAYRWQWQLGRLLKAQGRTTEAIAAYTETVNTLKSLRSDLVAVNADVQFSFRDEVEPIYRQLVSLLLQSEGTTQPSQENLVQARAVIESLQLAELDNFFRAACVAGQPVQIDEVIDRDDPTAAVIYPIVLADRLEVILKLPKQPLRHYKSIITQNEVETLVDGLRPKLTKPHTLRETQSLSKQVYDWLIKPAEAQLQKSNIKTLVFVLDGSLRNIPMAALYDGQQYLLQKYAVALTPGLQLLPPKSLQRTQLKALTAGLSEARQQFPALINVAQELEEIKSQLPSTILLNQDFTSTSFQKEINTISFPVVHLATHGQFSSKADETFILTWDSRINVNQLNELLRVRGQTKPTAIELLVLSACQTATGDKRAALGLAGVAVRAGARSTLASLWSVDDESTAQLMSQFYRELANSQLSKAEALRQAQLKLLKNPKYQRPLFWAPYVLVGNWL